MKVEHMPAIVATGLIPAHQVRLSDMRRVVGRINGSATHGPAEVQQAQYTVDSSQAELEIAALQVQVNSQAAELHKLRELVIEREKSAYAEGFEAGEGRGLAAAVERAQARQALLVQGVAEAAEKLEQALQRLDGVASTLAMVAVEEIVGDATDVKERVQQVVRRQLGRLREALPLRVRVSHVDFPDLDPLRRMLHADGLDGVEIVVDTSLESGGCRIQLRLGEVDAGLRQQLGALASLLGVEPDGSR
jgi:flagellar biosynthesis/type III secretory pathway protein FliH